MIVDDQKIVSLNPTVVLFNFYSRDYNLILQACTLIIYEIIQVSIFPVQNQTLWLTMCKWLSLTLPPWFLLCVSCSVHYTLLSYTHVTVVCRSYSQDICAMPCTVACEVELERNCYRNQPETYCMEFKSQFEGGIYCSQAPEEADQRSIQCYPERTYIYRSITCPCHFSVDILLLTTVVVVFLVLLWGLFWNLSASLIHSSKLGPPKLPSKYIDFRF